MSGFCSAHKHYEPGCPQCEAGHGDVTVQCFICGADLVISKEDYEIADVGTNPIACWKHDNK